MLFAKEPLGKCIALPSCFMHSFENGYLYIINNKSLNILSHLRKIYVETEVKEALQEHLCRMIKKKPKKKRKREKKTNARKKKLI